MKGLTTRAILFSLFIFAIASSENLFAQNVGIGIASPATKLHVAGTSSTLRLEGLSSVLGGTHITSPAASTDKLTFVNSNGDFKAMPSGVSGQTLTINGSGVPAWTTAAASTEWSLNGNSGTTAGTNFIGTIDAIDWVVKTTNTERMRIASTGVVGINTAVSATTRLFIDAGSTMTSGLTVNHTNSTTSTYAIRGNSTVAGSSRDGYLGYFGTVTVAGISVTNPAVYGGASTTTGTGVLATTSGTATSAPLIGLSSIWHGAFTATNLTSTSSASYASGIVALHSAAALANGYGNGVLASTAQPRGAGLYGSNTNASGTGNINIGQNAAFYYTLAAGSGSSTTGLTYGVAGYATSPSSAANGVYGVYYPTNQASGAQGNGVTGSAGVYGLNNRGLALSQGNYGVYGTYSTAIYGVGVIGIGLNGAIPSTTSADIGMWGSAEDIGVVGINGATVPTVPTNAGVFGYTNNTAGYGMLSQNANNTGAGLLGQNTAASGAGSGDGVQGSTAQNAGGFGVYASSTNATGTGMAALGNNGGTIYYLGTGTGGTFTGTDGLNSIATGANGTGVIATGNGILTYSTLAAGSGAAFTGNSTGVYGYGSNTASSTGVYGFSARASDGLGVIGAGNNQAAIIPAAGSGVAGTGTILGVYGKATSTANNTVKAGGYFETDNTAYAYVGTIDATNTAYKIQGVGSVSTIVEDMNGKKVALTCPEAPEMLFQDYGTGSLVNGIAKITLDPVFAKNIVVDQKHPMRVFIQLEGDCNGVYVFNKTGEGFEVKELSGGSSNVPFTWFVTANRADEILANGTVSKYSSQRFPDAMLPQNSIEADNLKSKSGLLVGVDAASKLPKNEKKDPGRKLNSPENNESRIEKVQSSLISPERPKE